MNMNEPKPLSHRLMALWTDSYGASEFSTKTAPHIRDSASVERFMRYFVFASVPTLAMGLWNFGVQTLQSMSATRIVEITDWQWSVYAGLGFNSTSNGIAGPLILGLAYFLPLLFMTLAAGVFWESLFAVVRRRRVDPGWFTTCWLYALMLPAILPPGFALLGISFGLVFGKHIFGGTGRYIVSPALLGVIFLQLSYPGNFSGAGSFVPISGLATDTTWMALVTQGLAAPPGTGFDLTGIFLGLEIGATATGSAMLCIVGAAYLVAKGVASLRVVLGALAGLILASLALDASADSWTLPWYWHVSFGYFAFGIAFIATDPTPGPMTSAARWVYGLLIGILTVLIRSLNPAHPDGTLHAILLATLAVPLIDYCVVRMSVARWRRRWRST